MHTLTVALGERSYAIHVGAGLLARVDLIAARLPQPKTAIVTNTTIAPLYLRQLEERLQALGIETVSIVLPDGEAYKNSDTLNRILDVLIDRRCERKTAVLVLGGGVVGDLAGFAAAVYQRGVPYIQLPTTLLAQVDSSVGGKTAINHPRGKNMIGAFYQPLAVVADTNTLKTLPSRELAAGIAEVIKYGIIRDRPFFEWLEQNIEQLLSRQPDALAHAILASCRNKAEVVALDERETGLRALLNFGHTFGHAIEAGLGYGVWLHGEAVACGMVLAARASERLGLVGADDVGRLRELLERAGLPVARPDLGFERYLELMGHDKKVEAGRTRFILLRGIGEAFVADEVPGAVLRATLDYREHG